MRTIEELEAGLRGAGEMEHLGGPDLDRIRRDGRRRRTARRSVGAIAVAAAVAGVVVGVPSLLDLDPAAETRQEAGVAAAPDTDAELVATCREGNQTDRSTELLFSPGDPVVKAQGRTSHKISVALESADGKFWADCFIALDDQEFASGIEVHRADGETTSSLTSYGPGCGLVERGVDVSCSTFSVSKVERRPEEVASVEIVTADGVATTVQTHDGYFAFEYLGELPEGTRITENGLPMDFRPIKRITFLDASGTPIAAEAEDGSGTGPDRNRVGDLPLLTAYPVQGSDPVY